MLLQYISYNHLETGTWQLRHHLTYLRLLYHHHILTRPKEETISKIYFKQKEEPIKGNWFQLLKKDFEFIEIDLNEEKIMQTSKSEYKSEIKALVHKATFKYFMNKKKNHSKLDEIKYTKLQLQPYLSSSVINNKQKELLYILRSKCHNSKKNFKKLNRNNLFCALGCSTNEDQIHVFTQCTPIKNKSNNSNMVQYSHISGSLPQQIQVIKVFDQIDKARKHIMKNHLLPGGPDCQDPCTLDTIFNGAADASA